jgi:hypothetical protein
MSNVKDPKPGAPVRGKLESRYTYYRCCQQVRKDGRQCKGPALKEEDFCYAHQQQAEARARLEEFRRSLGLPQVLESGPVLQKALEKLMQALIDSRVDENIARALLDEMSEAVSGDLQRHRPTTSRGACGP